jgi:uncharacterized protein (DUF1800 family)
MAKRIKKNVKKLARAPKVKRVRLAKKRVSKPRSKRSKIKKPLVNTPTPTPAPVNNTQPPPNNTQPPVSLSSLSEAARFLGHATMGANRAQIEELRSLGYVAWLNQQFAMPLQGTRYDWMAANNDPETGSPFISYEFRFNQNGFDAAAWRKLLSSPDALRQRVVFALSEIIVVSIDGLDGFWPQFRAAAYLDLLETHAFGNYRQLLQAISTNAAMAQYLTFLGNQKHDPDTGANPDENYARELLQLFTIGLHTLNLDGTKKLVNGLPVETYQQSDISQLARIFTGWEWDPPYWDKDEPSFARRPMIQIPDLHETGASTFLNNTVPAGLDGAASLSRALDIIFAHPNVAPFVSRQLIQKLVTSNPAPGYVARVATVFNNNGSGVKGDMKAVISAILLDSEARSSANLSSPTFGKLREPMLRFTAWARAFNITSMNNTWDLGWVRGQEWGLGQAPLHSPSVFNFFRPGYVPPNSAIATAGLVAPELQLTNESSVVGYLNFMQYAVYSFSNLADSADQNKNVRVDYSNLMSLASNPAALVSEVDLLLTANQLSASTLNTITNAITQVTNNPRARVLSAVLLVLASPEFMVSK